jgi:hypothetical protein
LVACDSNLIFSRESNYNYAVGNRKMGIDEWKREFNGRYDKYSISADPMFYNVDLQDFRLRQNSPALKMGIAPIDMDKIGIQQKK